MWQRSESLASIRTKRSISMTLPQGCAKITWFERSSVCLVWDDAETCQLDPISASWGELGLCNKADVLQDEV